MNAVTTPDDAEMPEIAAHGSLAAALHALAPDLRIEPEHDRRVRIPSTRPGRDPLSVAPAAVAGMWAFGAWTGGIQMIHGMCGVLTDLVPVATAWQDGVLMSDIKVLAPFASVPRRAEAYDHGPDHVVSEEWRALHERADSVDWPQFRDLVATAAAEPRLRQLYPYASHWSLRFSTTTGYPFSPDLVILDAPHGGGRFGVRTAWSGPVTEADSAAEAVALAVAHLPADLGPAVAGRYHHG